MDEWVKKTLEYSMAEAQRALSAATIDFKDRLNGVWGRLIWACIGGRIDRRRTPLGWRVLAGTELVAPQDLCSAVRCGNFASVKDILGNIGV